MLLSPARRPWDGLSKKLKCYLGLLLFSVFMIFLENTVWEPGTKIWKKLDSGTTCPIPKIDSSLKSSRALIELEGTVLGGSPSCIGKEVVFEVDHNSNLLRIGNDSEFWKAFDCCYSPFNRSSVLKFSTMDEHNVSGEICLPVRQDVTKIPEHYYNLDIKCIRRTTKDVVHRYQIQNQPLTLNRKIYKPDAVNPKDKLSILIVGLDSVSQVNFLRYMEATHNFLMRNLSAIEYHGLNIVGRGTKENVMALTTGCRLEHSDYVDPKCQLIWTEFSAHGYTSLHSEDSPYNTNNIYPIVRGKRNGVGADFDNSEYLVGVHHIHSFSVANKKGFVDNFGCFGNQFIYDVFMGEALRTARSLRGDSLYFNFIWTTTVTHQVIRATKYMDEPTYRLLVQMKTENLLNNTLVVLLADTGLGFGDYRYSQTSTGAVENLMPLLYFVFPDWFKQKYNTAITNLKLNSERLSTHYDIYLTLMDLLNPSNLKLETDNTSSQDQLGQSLFKPLPLNRTCEMANIPPQYCICWKRTKLPDPGKNSVIIQGTNFAVTWLNNKTSLFPMCEQLKLSQIIFAESLKSRIESDTGTNYQVIFETIPNRGQFRATMTLNSDSDNFEMVGEVARVNKYKPQSDCISEWRNATYVKTICYCKH